MEIELVLERITTNKLTKIDDQRKEIASSANKRANCPGITGKASKLVHKELIDDNNQTRQHYTFNLTLEKATYKTEESAIKHLESARKYVERAAEVRDWVVKGEASEVAEREVAADTRPELVVPELTNEVKEKYFTGIKERDAHLRMMYTSISTYRETNGEERNHMLLYGDPASAKSSVILGFKKWLDEVNGTERIMHINATTLSKAGLENLLLEKAQNKMLPECVWINELEKGQSDDFLCLLSVMDGIGKIQRLNSKIGKREEVCNVLIIADCNDAQKVKEWQKGAIWSRFVKKLPCVRPSRQIMTEILYGMIEHRRKKGYSANKAWVKAAIDYAFDKVHNNDPRFIKSLLEGKDNLLNGSYFKDLEDIQRAYEIAESAKMTG